MFAHKFGSVGLKRLYQQNGEFKTGSAQTEIVAVSTEGQQRPLVEQDFATMTEPEIQERQEAIRQQQEADNQAIARLERVQEARTELSIISESLVKFKQVLFDISTERAKAESEQGFLGRITKKAGRETNQKLKAACVAFIDSFKDDMNSKLTKLVPSIPRGKNYFVSVLDRIVRMSEAVIAGEDKEINESDLFLEVSCIIDHDINQISNDLNKTPEEIEESNKVQLDRATGQLKDLYIELRLITDDGEISRIEGDKIKSMIASLRNLLSNLERYGVEGEGAQTEIADINADLDILDDLNSRFSTKQTRLQKLANFFKSGSYIQEVLDVEAKIANLLRKHGVEVSYQGPTETSNETF